ncbi:MAG: BrnT family toxin [Acidobacteriota bacterium]
MAIFFEWDDEKAKENLDKHGISFDAARTVFFDPYRMTEEDSVVDGEHRWRTVGTASGIAVIVVAHLEEAFAGDVFVRMISARRAVPMERREYEQNRANDI